MSFSNDVKNEIIKSFPEDDCCERAELCAIIHCIGSIVMSRSGMTFSIFTDNLDLIDFTKHLIGRLFAQKLGDIALTSKRVGKTEKFEMEVPVELGLEVLLDCGIIVRDEAGNLTISRGTDHHIIIEDCCKISYLKGVFLSVGLVSVPFSKDSSIPDKKSSGYHLEMQFTSNEQAMVTSHLMAEFGLLSKKIEKRENFLVYLKDGDSISDYLALIGANKAVLTLQSEMVNREVRNHVNRESNCISANIDKTISAGLNQLRAIEIIDSTIGIDNLPKNLVSVARARQNNPEASLIELTSLVDEKITKAGINYKLKKIIEIANNIYGG